MRNDVKLGFAIGGVLLAVLIVYVLVVPGGTQSGRKVSQQSGNAPVATARDGNITLEPAAGAGATTQPTALAPGQTTDTEPTDPFASKTGSAAGASVAQAPQNSDLDWNKLLNDQPVLMIDTPVKAGPKESLAPVAVAKPTESSAPVAQSPTAATPAVVPQAPAPTIVAQPLTPPSTRPSGAVTASKTHKIAEGETLSSISTSAYGNPNQYPAILKANPGLDPQRLRIGQTINLPDLATMPPGDAVAQPAAGRLAATIDSSRQYRVAAGDSLHKISQKLYGDIAHAEKIFELNASAMSNDRHKLRAGQVIQLPEPPTVSQTSAAGH